MRRPTAAVRVALDRAGDDYVISVADDGPGIPAEIQPRIFERFYRVDAARTHASATAAPASAWRSRSWIARVHGGEVTLAASSRLGSTFVITLPAPAQAGP